MPLVQTDDAARRQTFVWLGSPTMPWPFEATGRSWAVGVLAVPTLTVGAFGLARLLTAPLPARAGTLLVGLVVLAGLVAGILLTRRIGRVLSPTRPIRHHLLTLQAELNAPREPAPTSHTVTSVDGLWMDRQDLTTHQLLATDFGDDS